MKRTVKGWVKVKYLKDWWAFKKGDIDIVSLSSLAYMLNAGIVEKEKID